MSANKPAITGQHWFLAPTCFHWGSSASTRFVNGSSCESIEVHWPTPASIDGSILGPKSSASVRVALCYSCALMATWPVHSTIDPQRRPLVALFDRSLT